MSVFGKKDEQPLSAAKIAEAMGALQRAAPNVTQTASERLAAEHAEFAKTAGYVELEFRRSQHDRAVRETAITLAVKSGDYWRANDMGDLLRRAGQIEDFIRGGGASVTGEGDK